MLINLKVKTLDAQTHEFSIDNEITVREFKDKIAEKTQIAAENQRIIYCGRVMTDDKKLQEYDLEGKVVHVAERPPPSQRIAGTNNDEPPPRTRHSRGMRNSPLFRALDGMVVGTMAIPMNGANSINNGPTLNHPFTSSSSFCMNRITVARHMLECANNIAAYLEDPRRGLNNTSLDILTRGRWTMESTVVEVGITAAADMQQNQNIVDMVQGAVTAALRRNGNTNVTVLQLPTVFGSGENSANATGNAAIQVSANNQPLSDIAAATAAIEAVASDDNAATAAVIIEDVTDNEEEGAVGNAESATIDDNTNDTQPDVGDVPAADSNESTPTGANSTSTASSNNNASNSVTNRQTVIAGRRRRRTGTAVLAGVIEQMRQVQSRLEPFVQQFYDMCRVEPVFEQGDTTARENAQRLYDRVSEALHYMSHAQHAISDLMLDFSQPTPRFLTCRPILVEQSGYVSSNNYITAGNHPLRQPSQASNNQQHNHSATASTANIANISTSNNANNGNGVSATTAAVSTGATSSTSATATTSQTAAAITVEDPVDDPIVAPTRTDLTTGNNAATGSQNAIDESVEIVLQPPPALFFGNNAQMNIARLFQAVVNSAPMETEVHLQINAPTMLQIDVPVDNGNNSASTTSATTIPANNVSNTATPQIVGTNTAVFSGTPASNQNQARANTVTLPTTSTQTRSTSRPQLQIGSMPPGWNRQFLPNNVVSSFDRFLPCNSHHIRETESQTNNANNNSNNNSSSGTNIIPTTAATGSNATPRSGDRQQATWGAIHDSFLSVTSAAQRATTQHFLQNLMTQMRPNANASNVGSTASTSGTGVAASAASGDNVVVRAIGGANTIANNETNDQENVTTNSSETNIAQTNSPIRARMVIPGTNEYRRFLHNQLATLMNERVFQGRTVNSETIPAAIKRVIDWFNESFLYFLIQYERPEYDSRISVTNIVRASLILVIELFKDEQFQNFEDFEIRLKELFKQFLQRLISVLDVCVGPSNATIFYNQLLRLLKKTVIRYIKYEALDFLMGCLTSATQSNINAEDAQQFIVERNVINLATDNQAMDVDVVMEDIALSASSSSITSHEASPVSLPNVVIDSEPWHRNFPSDWLPVLTRDVQVQQQISPVTETFSDAYISGMSVKRRKLVQSNKPPTDMEALISDGVRKAIQTAGVGSSTASNSSRTPDDVAKAFAKDNNVNRLFAETVSNNIRERIKSDPDYKADKYPRTSTFINKCKPK